MVCSSIAFLFHERVYSLYPAILSLRSLANGGCETFPSFACYENLLYLVAIWARDTTRHSHDSKRLARLVAEGVTTEQASAGFSLAYADKAEKEHTANTLRIPVADCSARAAALN